MDETNPHEIDPIKHLSDLGSELTEVQIREEYELLKPALCDLYITDRGVFATAAELVKEKLGIGRQDLEAAVRPLVETAGRGPAQATQLVALAESAEFFHTPDGEPWATIPVNEHQEHWPLKAQGFRRWLARQFYEKEKKTPGSQAIQDALGVFEGKAVYEGQEFPVFTRVAAHEGTIYLDLANERWEALEISSQGWHVVASPPVRFRRTRGMLPLPLPVTGGSIDELRPFVNVREEDWVLLLAWLIMCYSPKGPYPVIGLGGEQGSTKSTTARVLRSLIDPSSAPLRTAPREERDLMISANAGWILAFDNLSFLPRWLSDAFCRLATGGGFSTRELYSNDEETIFDAQRPVAFTAIEDIVLAGDLVDRGIRLLLPAVPKQKRRAETEFWQTFETARPRILGALLDVVVVALRNLPCIKVEELPRMADFALWVTAAEPALGWKRGTFLTTYRNNRNTANSLILESSLVAKALQQLAEQEQWEGTAAELLDKLTLLLPEKETKTKSWPKNPLTLSNTLRRLAPSLRTAGFAIGFHKTAGKDSKLIILIRKETEPSDASDADDAPRDFARENGDVPKEESDATGNGATHGDAHPTPSDAKNSNKNKPCDARGDSVASKHMYSKPAWREEI